MQIKKGGEEVQNHMIFLVNILRKGGQGPIVLCWREQTGNSPRSTGLSQAGWCPTDRAEGCEKPGYSVVLC